MSSKEIGRELGLSPHSVDSYIKAAVQRIGASNRREAARLLLERDPSQKLVSQPPPVADPPAPADDRARAESGWLAKLLFPIPLGGRLHSLGTTDKIILAARAGVSGVVMLLAIVTVYMGLLTVF